MRHKRRTQRGPQPVKRSNTLRSHLLLSYSHAYSSLRLLCLSERSRRTPRLTIPPSTSPIAALIHPKLPSCPVIPSPGSIRLPPTNSLSRSICCTCPWCSAPTAAPPRPKRLCRRRLHLQVLETGAG